MHFAQEALKIVLALRTPLQLGWAKGVNTCFVKLFKKPSATFASASSGILCVREDSVTISWFGLWKTAFSREELRTKLRRLTAGQRFDEGSEVFGNLDHWIRRYGKEGAAIDAEAVLTLGVLIYTQCGMFEAKKLVEVERILGNFFNKEQDKIDKEAKKKDEKQKKKEPQEERRLCADSMPTESFHLLHAEVNQTMQSVNAKVDERMKSLHAKMDQTIQQLNSAVEQNIKYFHDKERSNMDKRMKSLDSKVDNSIQHLNATVDNTFQSFDSKVGQCTQSLSKNVAQFLQCLDAKVNHIMIAIDARVDYSIQCLHAKADQVFAALQSTSSPPYPGDSSPLEHNHCINPPPSSSQSVFNSAVANSFNRSTRKSGHRSLSNDRSCEPPQKRSKRIEDAPNDSFRHPPADSEPQRRLPQI
uniref:Death domain-containing protein n=1 Tax=Steinernema glaseri TaxID=37863 RepID=A0A1I7YFU5_9BILA